MADRTLYWSLTASPVGELLLTSTDEGLISLSWDILDPGAAALDIATSRSLVARHSVAAHRQVNDQLDAWFSREIREFDLSLADDPRLGMAFSARVLAVTSLLPIGGTASYGEVARQAGSPRGARAAGSALARNPLPIIIPCHRVVAANGKLGGFSGGLSRKKILLAIESG